MGKFPERNDIFMLPPLITPVVKYINCRGEAADSAKAASAATAGCLAPTQSPLEPPSDPSSFQNSISISRR
jgi:hypothetical protein